MSHRFTNQHELTTRATMDYTGTKFESQAGLMASDRFPDIIRFEEKLCAYNNPSTITGSLLRGKST